MPLKRQIEYRDEEPHTSKYRDEENPHTKQWLYNRDHG
jgi:hypothetical protein